MGKQYKELSQRDMEFIKAQKLFYIASCSGKEVNLSPKGYDTIRIVDETTVVYLDYPGSGNRTYRDLKAGGDVTVLFNAFEGKPQIMRLFCKGDVIAPDMPKFAEYRALFSEEDQAVRNIFELKIYAVETSCGESVPVMEYKHDRNEIKEWVEKMHNKGKLDKYIEDHFTPPNLEEL